MSAAARIGGDIERDQFVAPTGSTPIAHADHRPTMPPVHFDRTQMQIPNPFSGWRGRLVAPLLRLAERGIGLQRMQAFSEQVARLPSARGPGEAWGRVLRIRAETERGPLEAIPTTGPLIVVGNHAMGGPDAIAMAALLEQVRPRDGRFLVNTMLARAARIGEVSFAVDVFGGPDATRGNLASMKAAVAHVREGGALAAFPAGEVSHLTWSRRSISDPAWSPTVAAIAARTQATIVPVFFHGRNRWRFQIAGLVHPRLRTLLLPWEALAAQGSSVRFAVGSPIPWRQLEAHGSPQEITEYLRARTYLLRDRVIDPAHVVNLIEKLPPVLPSSRQRPRRRRLQNPPGAAAVPGHPGSPPKRFAAEIEALGSEGIMLQHRDWDVVVGRREQLPKVVEEIGRLREIAFREVGEGSGKRLDLDSYDDTYLHLFLWDRRRQEVLGAYRLGPTDEILPSRGIAGLYTHTLFEFGEPLIRQITPALELGRSFVRPEYQRHPAALMLLWKGIGRFLARHPRYRMMFGPVSISNAYQSMSRRLLISFLSAAPRLSGLGRLIRPRNPVALAPVVDFNETRIRRVVADLDEVDQLVREIESGQRRVPVLLRQYLKLNAKLLGFNIDSTFCDCLDGLMLVDLLEVDRRIMDQYLGEEGAAAFMAHHRRSEIASEAAQD